MLKLINEELMAFTTTEVTDKNTGKEYTKIKVVTSNKLQQYENDRRYPTRENNKYNRQQPNREINTPKVGVVSHVDKTFPINREIIRISAPLTYIGDFLANQNTTKSVNFNLPMSINVNSTNKYQPNVEIRCHEQGDDRANVYVIAFPFNGMIRPLPENPQYRIYKGLIASSVKPFFFNNRKYRKVLYLIIEVNKNLFDPNHKYHTNSIDIQLESYALFDDRETGEKKTNCEVFKLSITSPSGDHLIEWKYDVADTAIMMNAEPGQQLWTTYSFENSHQNKPTATTPYKGNKSHQKPITMEGDVMITTNRHGIRKEVPIKQSHPRTSRRPAGDQMNRDDSIDHMMQKSGMYDNEYNKRSKKNGGKKNNKGRKYDRY